MPCGADGPRRWHQAHSELGAVAGDRALLLVHSEIRRLASTRKHVEAYRSLRSLQGAIGEQDLVGEDAMESVEIESKLVVIDLEPRVEQFYFDT
jgi:hypothetical protein